MNNDGRKSVNCLIKCKASNKINLNKIFEAASKFWQFLFSGTVSLPY